MPPPIIADEDGQATTLLLALQPCGPEVDDRTLPMMRRAGGGEAGERALGDFAKAAQAWRR